MQQNIIQNATTKELAMKSAIPFNDGLKSFPEASNLSSKARFTIYAEKIICGKNVKG